MKRARSVTILFLDIGCAFGPPGDRLYGAIDTTLQGRCDPLGRRANLLGDEIKAIIDRAQKIPFSEAVPEWLYQFNIRN